MSERKILMVLPEFYPGDIRVSKEVDALEKAGYRMTIVCNRKKGQKKHETLDKVTIHRVMGSATFSQKGITDILTAIFFINPFFLFALYRYSNMGFVAVHVHDLPLLKTAKMVFGNKIPIVVDMHENYPEALRVWFQWKKNPIIRFKNKLFFGFSRWSKYEQWAVRKADRVIAVVDEMKERFLATVSGLDEKKITVVSNTEGKNFLGQVIDRDIFQAFNGKFLITYTGNVGPHRGVDTLIKSAHYLEDKDNIQILVIGKMSADTEAYLKELIKKHELTNVQLWGYRPFEKFYSYMHQTDVNIIPHNKNGHTDHTIPHKLFQAMMCQRPVIVSDCKPLDRVVSNAKSGLVFKAGDAQDLAAKIQQLYSDSSLCKTLAENGHQATVQGELNWEFESRKIVELYDSL